MSSRASLALKFLMVGDSGVGKTSLVQMMEEKKFSENLDSTRCYQFSVLPMNIDGIAVNIQLWDTAGQEAYRALSKHYFRDAIGVLLVFSMIEHSSFEHLDEWLNDIKLLCHPKVKILLVGNKIDKKESKEVSNDEITQFIKDRDLDFIETSAKDNKNVYEAFYNITKMVVDGIKTNDITFHNSGQITNKTSEKDKSGCAC